MYYGAYSNALTFGASSAKCENSYSTPLHLMMPGGDVVMTCVCTHRYLTQCRNLKTDCCLTDSERAVRVLFWPLNSRPTLNLRAASGIMKVVYPVNRFEY